MSRDVIDQYETIRKAVIKNVEAIRALLAQADSLNEVVNGVSDPETKEKLTSSIDALYTRIDELVDQTDDLFNLLIKFSESVSVATSKG